MIIKHKKIILLGVLFLFFYLVSRLINLTALPVFTDEAIYLRWAQTARFDANWRFISLVDGKQPLYIWLAMIMMRFINDPLVAGRAVSVICGAGSMLMITLLTYILFHDKKASIISALLYLVFPFALFFDRMALMESLLVLTTLSALYFEILLVRYLRLDVALLLGMAMGAAMLTKTSGFFSLYLLPFSLLLFDFSQKEKKGKLIKWIVLAIISAVMSQIYYAVLRLSPLYHMVAQKDTTFIYPFQEWMNHPFEFFIGNFRGMSDWLISYLSWPIILVLIISFVFLKLKYWKERLLLTIWFILPFTALALFGKVLYPRFILFMTAPLLAILAFSISKMMIFIKNIKLQIIFILILIIPSMFLSHKIIFDIKNAPLTPIDKGQYINDWPSGWGVNEVVKILKKEVDNNKKIAIYTDGTFGLMPYAIELYLVYNNNVYIKGIWPLDDKFPEEILKMSLIKPTYLITNQKQNIPPTWPIELVGQWKKGINDNVYLRLFKVVGNNFIGTRENI